MNINLSLIGHDENIAYEIAHKDILLRAKYPEAEIDGDLPEIEQEPTPDWFPPTEKKRSILSRLNILLV